MEIRSLTIPYAKNKAKNIRTLEKQLESRLESLENNIDAKPDDGTDSEQQEYERLKTELCRIYGEGRRCYPSIKSEMDRTWRETHKIYL